MKNDKLLEQERYDAHARSLAYRLSESPDDWHEFVPVIYREPYFCYEAKIRSFVHGGMDVLEIGCGVGAFTGIVLRTGANVCAMDISAISLERVRARYPRFGNLETKQADMEALPFPDGSFDAVTSAGSLSYGDNEVVMNEIHRVLRPGGQFICVDSFNHNPVYRFNRWMHYLKGNRTRGTLVRMPSMRMIEQYGLKFSKHDVRYFGSLSWLMGVMAKLFGADRAARLSTLADRVIGVRRSAFKIVMVATK